MEKQTIKGSFVTALKNANEVEVTTEIFDSGECLSHNSELWDIKNVLYNSTTLIIERDDDIWEVDLENNAIKVDEIVEDSEFIVNFNGNVYMGFIIID